MHCAIPLSMQELVGLKGLAGGPASLLDELMLLAFVLFFLCVKKQGTAAHG